VSRRRPDRIATSMSMGAADVVDLMGLVDLVDLMDVVGAVFASLRSNAAGSPPSVAQRGGA